MLSLRLRNYSKPIEESGKVEERLRPRVKPEDVSQREWERSECKASPTGAHYFKLSGRPPDGFCIYCSMLHSEIYPEPYLRGGVK